VTESADLKRAFAAAVKAEEVLRKRYGLGNLERLDRALTRGCWVVIGFAAGYGLMLLGSAAMNGRLK
jgi:hypothetical protein